MDNPLGFYNQLLQDYDNHPHAVDLAHSAQLFGMILAKKPQMVLELGIGTGFLSKTILAALAYNGRGTLHCVDNWFDTGGYEPPISAEIRALGALVEQDDEDVAVKFCPTDRFDMLISDADHERSHQWLDEHLRIVRGGGFLFFHDVNTPDEYPGLYQIRQRVSYLPHILFTQWSRPEERCKRGWLMVENRKV